MAYSDDQLERLEALLLKDRERTVRALTRHNERFANRDGGDDTFAFSLHLADQGTKEMDQKAAFLLASEEGRMLNAIDAALRRLYREPEAFGRCENCGEEIGYARLEAVPYATRCISCQIEQERGA